MTKVQESLLTITSVLIMVLTCHVFERCQFGNRDDVHMCTLVLCRSDDDAFDREHSPAVDVIKGPA